LRLPLLLLALVVLQGAFGAWTVTLKLWPQVVTAHLIGGMTTLALLWLLFLRIFPFGRRGQAAQPDERFRTHAAIALAAVIVQIVLGGWTTSNYAALACPDLPTCQGRWWPAMDFRHGFAIAQSVGPNYLGGLLEGEARVAIHMAHRIGAVVVLLLVGGLALRMARVDAWRRAGLALGALVLLQFALGVSNVWLSLPLAVATAHNATGALLLLASVSVNYRSFHRAGPDRSAGPERST
jgi:cytochrome c oxidase assembly protein subunit 15